MLSMYPSCIAAVLTLQFNTNTKTFNDLHGLQIRVLHGKSGLVTNNNFEQNCQYTQLLSYFDRMKYKENINLHIIPYDWRRSITSLMNNHYHTSNYQMEDILDTHLLSLDSTHEPLHTLSSYVISLIERTYLLNKRRVMLIGHGTGTDHLLSIIHTCTSSWQHQYIEAVIAITSDLAGSMEHILAIGSGVHVQSKGLLPLSPQLALVKKKHFINFKLNIDLIFFFFFFFFYYLLFLFVACLSIV
jgi:hypothetical protein